LLRFYAAAPLEEVGALRLAALAALPVARALSAGMPKPLPAIRRAAIPPPARGRRYRPFLEGRHALGWQSASTPRKGRRNPIEIRSSITRCGRRADNFRAAIQSFSERLGLRHGTLAAQSSCPGGPVRILRALGEARGIERPDHLQAARRLDEKS